MSSEMWNPETQRTQCNKCGRSEMMRYGEYWESENHIAVTDGIAICKWCAERYLQDTVSEVQRWIAEVEVKP